ncbi:tRNA pseudouridine(38/39) synthase [Sparassis crispa]|uniref:tRNA pseudouridine(38/39) synthase n=1 Tax=Sparassis crispa TaxID=139825 RepID=A0A401GXY6_9APHY|nr:tRNA pseudouridine(38/39) synthase [Sparassis crispa]GBE87086.1 tRNA pseudouridine(38/39) synthase [Sparassis crispa]
MQSSPSAASTYDSWTREELIARLRQIDTTIHRQPAHRRSPTRPPKQFDYAAQPRRKIALKFTYDGSHYSGLEFQKTPSPLPTVESVLFDALVRTRLVDPKGGFTGCGWEKCGRTDRGVSAAGQVVSFWVRSALPEFLRPSDQDEQNKQDAASDMHDANENVEAVYDVDGALEGASDGPGLEGDFQLMADWDEPRNTSQSSVPPKPCTELHYISSLNNVLPPTIRIIAWSPVSDEFSARFSCRYRHYKYFFDPKGLDVSAMRDATQCFVGEHDFRNFCKIDASKQLTSFVRNVLSAEINVVNDSVYVLDLVGASFLYNQVRHIMAILFLVGTGMERPLVVNALFNTDAANPLPAAKGGEAAPPVVPSKPGYQIADPLPLMLWECGYDETAVRWRADAQDDETAVDGQRSYSNNLIQMLQSLHQRSVIHATLDAHFLRAASRYHSAPPQYFPVSHPRSSPILPGTVLRFPIGAGALRQEGNYVPLLQRPRAATAEEINEKWKANKDAKTASRRIDEPPEDGDE